MIAEQMRSRLDPGTGDLIFDVPGTRHPIIMDRQYLACYDQRSQERVIREFIESELGRRRNRRLFRDGRHDRGWRKA